MRVRVTFAGLLMCFASVFIAAAASAEPSFAPGPEGEAPPSSEPPVAAPASPQAASDGRTEPAPASHSPSSAAPPCPVGGCPKDGDGPPDPEPEARRHAQSRARVAAVVITSAPQPATSWYGYQNMLVDLGGITLVVMAVDKQSGDLAYLALATYLLGSPSVHWGHEQVGAGFGSLGLRVGAPLVGAGLGYVVATTGECGEWACVGGAALGGVVGAGAGMIIDYAVLAHEEAPEETAKRLRLTPSFALAPEAGRLMPSVGLRGTF